METQEIQKIEDSQETIKGTASTDTIVPDSTKTIQTAETSDLQSLPILRQTSETIVPSISKLIAENPGLFSRSISTMVEPTIHYESGATMRLSERAARIKAARERFLSSTVPMRREGTSSASDLRPGDRFVSILMPLYTMSKFSLLNQK